jgi:hypothetical protein
MNNQDRLLTEEEIETVLNTTWGIGVLETPYIAQFKMVAIDSIKAQDLKTARLVAEEIFRELEKDELWATMDRGEFEELKKKYLTP